MCPGQASLHDAASLDALLQHIRVAPFCSDAVLAWTCNADDAAGEFGAAVSTQHQHYSQCPWFANICYGVEPSRLVPWPKWLQHVMRAYSRTYWNTTFIQSHASEQKLDAQPGLKSRGFVSVFGNSILHQPQIFLASFTTSRLSSAVTPCVKVFKQTFCGLYLGVHWCTCPFRSQSLLLQHTCTFALEDC